jgi:ribosomal protein S1
MFRSEHGVPPLSWESFVTRHGVGDVLSGHVTAVLPFGAFVDVGGGVVGLLVMKEPPGHGTAVPVRVLAIDPDNRRVSLAHA